MMGVGMSELVIILVIALVIFGAGKLPEIGSSLGKGIRNFKKAAEGEPSPAQKTLPASEPPKQAADTSDGEGSEDKKEANP